MAYNEKLAERVRALLTEKNTVVFEEKKMFRGLAFLVNGKMTVNVSGEKLMVRFDPARQEELAAKQGFERMLMKDKVYKGYGYVHPDQLRTKNQLKAWVDLCLEFNPRAKSSKK